MRYRKKPVVIEAIQFTKATFDQVEAFVGGDAEFRGHELIVATLAGPLRVAPNDWIIKGVKGEIYPCKPDIFAATYTEDTGNDPVEDMRARKNAAYLERNRCVALIATMALINDWGAGIAKTAIEGWDEEWHGCVYIELPNGQVSWHYHDSHAHLFAHLPAYEGTWDGHTTEQKYERVAEFAVDWPARAIMDVGIANRELSNLVADCGGTLEVLLEGLKKRDAVITKGLEQRRG